MALHAIILSGGHGTRLWPASRPERPKQFLPLLGERSMFQSTVERMARATGDRAPIVVAGGDHAGHIRRQLAELGRGEAVLLVEPQGRDSAPAIAAAAAWIVRHDPDAVGVMVASDHALPDVEAFVAAVRTAAAAAEHGAIVTFGVTPTQASEAYGYIRPGEPLAGVDGAARVLRFAEKPDRETAERYIAGGYLWNSGNFVFRAATLLEELDRHAPEVARAARGAVEAAGDGPGEHRLGDAFLSAPKVSIDYAVMEKTDRAAVVPLTAAWSDLGAWDAVHAASERDAHGNAAPENAILHEARGSLVRVSTGQRVAVLGLEGVAVIVESDAVLVADLSASQGVKQVVERFNRDAAGKTAGADPEERIRRHARELGLWMRANALPLWGTLGADFQRVAFHETLDAQARPPRSSRRLRVQGRQAFVYAHAGARGWDGPWQPLAELGLRSIHEEHKRPDGPGYATLVNADGGIADDSVMLYDHAFILLAGAWAKRAGIRDDAEAEALAILDEVLEPRRGPHGGFREEDAKRPWQSNPHMHLFEAFQAWAQAGSSPRWAQVAEEIAELALTRFIDPQTGAVREFFKADWSPADGEDGRHIEPGHQFEWSWLLDGWGEAHGREDARRAARRLYPIGAGPGVDPKRGVAMNGMDIDLKVTDAGARLWPQTERMKAALRFADFSQGEERRRFLTDAADAIDGLRKYFEGLPPGLWRDKYNPDGTWVEEPSPASSLYHIAVAIAELEDRAPK